MKRFHTVIDSVGLLEEAADTSDLLDVIDAALSMGGSGRVPAQTTILINTMAKTVTIDGNKIVKQMVDDECIDWGGQGGERATFIGLLTHAIEQPTTIRLPVTFGSDKQVAHAIVDFEKMRDFMKKSLGFSWV